MHSLALTDLKNLSAEATSWASTLSMAVTPSNLRDAHLQQQMGHSQQQGSLPQLLASLPCLGPGGPLQAVTSGNAQGINSWNWVKLMLPASKTEIRVQERNLLLEAWAAFGGVWAVTKLIGGALVTLYAAWTSSGKKQVVAKTKDEQPAQDKA